MAWNDRLRDVEVMPSLYAADFAGLGSQVEQLIDAGVRAFHYDVGDGRFIEPITIGPVVLESISPIVRRGGAVVDAHLMTVEPERHFAQLAEAGAGSVTFHVEAVDDPARAVALARSLGLGAGIAFNPETAVEDVLPAADGVDLVLCMSIHPGYSGQAFMPEALPRIAELRDALPAHVRIQVDGGVNGETIADVRRAGADLLVVGSGLFADPDLGGAYRGLVERLTGAPVAAAVRQPRAAGSG